VFERFTDRARQVVVLAQEEARTLDHDHVGTEHLLLGLVREGDGVGARALGVMGISLPAVRAKVEAIIGRGEGAPPRGRIPFSRRAKKVLELSLREALQLGVSYIGTEHLLLGLIREGEGVAAQVLHELGADLGRVRQTVIQMLSGYAQPLGEERAVFREAEVEVAETGPRCPSCKLPLDGGLAYRTIMAERDDPEGNPIMLTVGYCSRCGTAIGTSLG
jgi:ATP-dependent Clp protease ATP-binding subunit ClpA